jgi:hypothetical protein
MKINGRFLLLAVATGLFIRLWSNADGGRPRVAATTPPTHVVQSGGESTSLLKGPQAGGTHPATIPHGEPAASAPGPSPTSKPVETATSKPVAPTPTAVHPGTPVRITEPGRVEDWTLERAPFRLPALSEGTWRVVDDTGRVAVLHIPAGRGTGAGTVGEFHVHPVGGVRWYFIRLTNPQTAATPSPNPTPAATELGVASTPDQDHSRGIGPTTHLGQATPTPAENAGVSNQQWADAPLSEEDLTNEQVVPQPPRVYTEAELAERAAVAVDLQSAAEAAADEQIFDEQAVTTGSTTTETWSSDEASDRVSTNADLALLPGVADEPELPQPEAPVESSVIESPFTASPVPGLPVADARSTDPTEVLSEASTETTSAPQAATTPGPAFENLIVVEPGELPEVDASAAGSHSQVPERLPTPIGLERLGAERPEAVDLPEGF